MTSSISLPVFYAFICLNESLNPLLYNCDVIFVALMAATGIQASRPEVRMADKIAMRSLVLSKNMPRIGGMQTSLKKYILVGTRFEPKQARS